MRVDKEIHSPIKLESGQAILCTVNKKTIVEYNVSGTIFSGYPVGRVKAKKFMKYLKDEINFTTFNVKKDGTIVEM